MDDGGPGDREQGEWLPPARSEPRLRIDPGFSTGHDGPPPPTPPRGDHVDWIIPAAIVLAGIVLAFAVIVSRSDPHPASATPSYSYQTVVETAAQTIAPVEGPTRRLSCRARRIVVS